RSCQNGGVHEPPLAQGAGLERDGVHRCAQQLASGADLHGVARLMYKRILVPLENTRTDEAIVAHVQVLAKHCGASIVLMHVAAGFAARNMSALELRESE